MTLQASGVWHKPCAGSTISSPPNVSLKTCRKTLLLSFILCIFCFVHSEVVYFKFWGLDQSPTQRIVAPQSVHPRALTKFQLQCDPKCQWLSITLSGVFGERWGWWQVALCMMSRVPTWSRDRNGHPVSSFETHLLNKYPWPASYAILPVILCVSFVHGEQRYHGG